MKKLVSLQLVSMIESGEMARIGARVGRSLWMDVLPCLLADTYLEPLDKFTGRYCNKVKKWSVTARRVQDCN